MMTNIHVRTTASDVLCFKASFLTDKLLKDGIADNAEESEALFNEVKRYLLLVHYHTDVEFAMYSRRIDAAWHSFVLFTEEYAKFCKRFFGTFLHHAPNEAPRAKAASSRTIADFRHFCSAYESMFGEEVPDLWSDHKSITLHRRLMNVGAGPFEVQAANSHAMLYKDGDCILTVNDLAAEALRFIAAMPHFYVRELPGELTDEEKLGIAEVLVEYGILRVSC